MVYSGDLYTNIGDFHWEISDDGIFTITSYNGTHTTVELTDIAEYTNISTIGTITALDTITGFGISENVQTFQNGAFYGLSSLVEVYTVINSAPDVRLFVQSVGENAFFGCTSLDSVTFTNISYLGKSAFQNCENLLNVHLDGTLSSLAAYTFSGCISLQTVTLPESITSIDCMAFGTTSFAETYVTFLGPVPTITDTESAGNLILPFSIQLTTGFDISWEPYIRSSFYGAPVNVYYNDGSGLLYTLDAYMWSVESINPYITRANIITGIPVRAIMCYVTSIRENGFENNMDLTCVSIPYSVTAINDYAFNNCHSLHTLQYRGTSDLIYIGTDVFTNTSITSISLALQVATILNQTMDTYNTQTQGISISLPCLTDYDIDTNAFFINKSLRTSCISSVTIRPNFTQVELFQTGGVFDIPNLEILVHGTNNTLDAEGITYTDVQSSTAKAVLGSTDRTIITSVQTEILNKIRAIWSQGLETGAHLGYSINEIDMVTLNNTLTSYTVVMNSIPSQLWEPNTQKFRVGLVDLRSTDEYLICCHVDGIVPSTYPIALDGKKYKEGFPIPVLYIPREEGESQILGPDLSGFYYKITVEQFITISVLYSSTLSSWANYIDGASGPGVKDNTFVDNTIILQLQDGTWYTFMIDSGSLNIFPLSQDYDLIQPFQKIGNILYFYDENNNPIVSPAIETYKHSTVFTYQSCLLKGTLVNAPDGPRRIETIRKGSYIYNQHTEAVLVRQLVVGHRNLQSDTDILYKVPKGQYGTTSDLYLTKGHRMMNKRGILVLPEKLGMQPAPAEEYCDAENEYTVYHIMVEHGEKNHLVVNGNCIVESWK